MPSTYAHYHFGNILIEGMPDNIKQIVTKYRELYDIGVHGPDILFYYEPYHHNETSAIGFGMHDIIASEFFTRAYKSYHEYPEKEAMMAYLVGFVSHFCLDYIDHTYVESKIRASHISHTEIEVEYDRHLMVKDGLNPFKKDPASHLVPSDFNIKVVSHFFKETDEKHVAKAFKGMVFYLRLLKSSNGFKRNFLYTAFRAVGQYDSLHDQVISKEVNPLCLDSNMRLDKLEKWAVELFRDLSKNMYEYLNDISPLDKRFDKTFSYQDNVDDIKVLPLEMEKTYEI